MEKKCVGIDVGGTSVKLGMFEMDGTLLEKWEIPTRKEENGRHILSDAASSIREKISEKGLSISDLAGAGLGLPGPVMPDGSVEVCVNLGWKNMNPQKELSGLLDGLTVKTGNDANVAALGEMWQGGGKGYSDLVMVTLGTGLGSGFVAGGRMIYGHDGMAGELGHVVVEPGGRQCGCGRRGCLETYVSATGIKRTVFELMARETVPSVLRDVPYDKFDARIITEAAQKGDSLALEVFRCTAERLGRALANAVAITSPEAVFFFGGLAQAGELLLEPTRRYLEENLLPVYRGNVKVLPSGIPAQNAAILGASALIWNE